LTPEQSFNTALEHHRAGRLQEAEALYRQILQAQPNYPDALHLLGVIAHQVGQHHTAVDFINRAIGLNPNVAEFHNNIGEAYRALDKLEEATGHYRQAMTLKPTYAEPFNNLGIVLSLRGQTEEAVAQYRRALALAPANAETHYNLGNALKGLGRLEEAAASYRQAVTLKPTFAEAYNNLGFALQEQGKLEEAVVHYQRAVALKPTYAEAYNNLGAVLQGLGQVENAMAQYQRALALKPDFAMAHNNLGSVLKEQGKLEEAVASYRQALALKPDYALARDNLGVALYWQGKPDEAVASYRQALALRPNDGIRIKLAAILPVIIRSSQDVIATRKQFDKNLAALLKEELALADPVREVNQTNFYLAYHGQNDRELQVKTARLYERACPALLYTAPHCSAKPQSRKPGKIKVGFISRFFRTHSIGKLTRGVLANLSKTKFSVYAIFVPPVVNDEMSAFIQRSADKTLFLPGNLQAARDRIAEEALDILVYPDIGMDPFTYFLAFSRLAPVQCATWGHPVTTGIRAMDYFISSENLEPSHAGRHYSERLVRLKRVPAYYYRTTTAIPLKSRSELGLDDGGAVYLCPQSLYKIHPDFDDVVGGILRAEKKGMVNFIEGSEKHWTELLMARFRDTIPDVADRVCFLPRQTSHDFLNLLSAADVILDPLHWSGGVTTYDALAFGTPIVTLPGKYMRGRVTYACYKQMRLMDCVAATKKDYVDLAVRLGTDQTYRAKIKAKILATNHALYEDAESVRGWEKFFLEAVRTARNVRP
jgi:predicted O-linked N-acetylglucosamine transferase (SPINDLY family)